jgi:hypothetical protein
VSEVGGALCRELRGDGAPDRARVARALETLAEALLAHLEFEAESVGPTMRQMTRHPLA